MLHDLILWKYVVQFGYFLLIFLKMNTDSPHKPQKTITKGKPAVKIDGNTHVDALAAREVFLD